MLDRDSFSFCAVDVWERFGIRAIRQDVLLPALRPRKIPLPQKSGVWDMGASFYEERPLTLFCDTLRVTTRADAREMAALFSQKGRLVLGEEPDKWYLARLYNATPLYELEAGQEFTLTFLCDPFAYGRVVDEPLPKRIAYQGTAPSPVKIYIRNTGATPIVGLELFMRERAK